MEGLWHRLDILARGLTPLMLTMILVLIGMVPLQNPDIAALVPSMALIAVYYWAVHRPDLLPLWVTFMIGLFEDLLSGGYVGVGILSLLLVYSVVELQRRLFLRASFQMLWMLFAMTAAGAMYLAWVLNCLLYADWLSFWPVLFQFLTTVAAYPLIAWLFAKAQRLLVR